MNKKRLGRGLGALLPSDEINIEGSDVQSKIVEINIEDIEPNPYQPRKEFNLEQLQELSDSIKEHGIIQPINIRKFDNKYQLVAGERRLRAAKLAGLTTIPAIESEYDEQKMMEIALIENIQREDLNPMEEALAYRNLMDQFGLTQEDVSNRVSKSRSAIANTIRLLNLPQEIQDYVSRETISNGHARALLSLGEEEEMLRVCNKVICDNLTVRQLEEYIKEVKNKKENEQQKTDKLVENKDEEVLAAEARMKNIFGRPVKIEANDRRTRITIDCQDFEDLQKVIKLLEEK